MTSLQGKNILLTGATGFVGTQILKHLLSLKINVKVVIRSEHKISNEIKSKISSIVFSRDLFEEDEEWWFKVCQDIDIVIHAAWYAEPGKYLESEKNLNCLIGSLNLAKGSSRAGIKKFIGIGTCFEYKVSDEPLSIESDYDPQTIYASTKLSLYQTLTHWSKINSIDFAWCRLFYLYGEGEDERRFVPYLHQQLKNNKTAQLTSGKQIRDYLDVKQAAKEIVDVSIGNQKGPINICSGVPITIKEFAIRIAKIYGREDLLNFGAREDNLVDPKFVVGVKNKI